MNVFTTLEENTSAVVCNKRVSSLVHGGYTQLLCMVEQYACLASIVYLAAMSVKIAVEVHYNGKALRM